MGDYPRVDLYSTEERKLFSNLAGREYQLAVYLPESYAASSQRYPVLYLLDSDMVFGMAANFTQFLCWAGIIPEHVIIGIGYKMRSYEELIRLRELDFKIPQVQDAPPDSQADRFLAGLRQEIMPFIESSYRLDSAQRTLYGFSSGGFFALYALCHEPGLFRRTLAGSADTTLSAPYLAGHDQELRRRENPTPIDLYLSVGSLETGESQSSVTSFQELAATIETRAYSGLRLATEIFPGLDHGPVAVTMTFINGLRACFQA